MKYKTKRSNFKGIISSNDLYQIGQNRKRLKKGITDKNSKLIRRNCNLLINKVNAVFPLNTKKVYSVSTHTGD